MHLCYNGRRFSDLGYECLVYLVCSNKASSHEKKRRLKIMKLGFIGTGNMAGAIMGGIIKKGIIPAEEIIGSDIMETGRNHVKELYGIQVTADNKEVAEKITVTTNETEPIEILNDAGITLTSDDVIDITKFEAHEGGTITISRNNTINVKFGETIKTYKVYAATVGDALNEIGIKIGKDDKLNLDASTPVENGMTVEIESALTVTLKVDGKTEKFTTTNSTVGDLLKLAGVTLGENDYVTPSADKKLTDKQTVEVFRVEYKTQSKTESVAYSTKEKKDSSLEKGDTKTVQQGKNGSKDVTYSVKYVNGVATESTKLTEVVKTQPVEKIVKVGTKEVKHSADTTPNGVKSKGGYSVGDTISGRYTHYCACAICNGNSRGITTSGKRIKNGMSNPYYVACNWLPLGSVIEVDGTNYTVVDRGGSGLSRRGRIDIFTPEGHKACYKYGTGSCKIKIVRLGW